MFREFIVYMNLIEHAYLSWPLYKTDDSLYQFKKTRLDAFNQEKKNEFNENWCATQKQHESKIKATFYILHEFNKWQAMRFVYQIQNVHWNAIHLR